MADLFSTDVLTTVVQSMLGNPSFLIDRYFPATQTETAEEIHFDVIDGKRRIAPFVSPLVEGQIVADRGYKTTTYKPAYIKDKRVFDMNRPLKRSAGEPIGGGSMSPMDRMRAMLAMSLQDQLDMLRRRMEVMAGQVLSIGKLTITGEKYPTAILDFGRSPANMPIAAKLWSDPTALPLSDLDTWAMQVLQATGVMLTDVLMTPDVWSVFQTNPQVKDHLTIWRSLGQQPSLSGNAPILEGGVYMGNIGTYNIYVYSGWYVDPTDGSEHPILPAGSCILTSPALEGVKAYGAIRDEEAGLQAMPYFVKSWIEPDPSVRFIMMQSAPIVVPYRPNASLSAKVL
jgi:hypothetical protein